MHVKQLPHQPAGHCYAYGVLDVHLPKHSASVIHVCTHTHVAQSIHHSSTDIQQEAKTHLLLLY